MARSLRFDPEASNEASKKRGCYRTRSDDLDLYIIRKPLFLKANSMRGRTLSDVAGHAPRRLLAPRAGFEPATIRLTVECSTAELPRNRRTWFANGGAYNKASTRCKGPNAAFQRRVERGGKRLCRKDFLAF